MPKSLTRRNKGRKYIQVADTEHAIEVPEIEGYLSEADKALMRNKVSIALEMQYGFIWRITLVEGKFMRTAVYRRA
jgi:hypothetical protein